jgi:hypothetical protein
MGSAKVIDAIARRAALSLKRSRSNCNEYWPEIPKVHSEGGIPKAQIDIQQRTGVCVLIVASKPQERYAAIEITP